MVRLDLAAVLAQWAAGGLAGLWITTRHRLLGTGYGWLVRGVFCVLAIGAAAAGLANDDAGTGAGLRDAGALAMAGLAFVTIVVSVRRRRVPPADAGAFPPALDLLAPLAGVVSVLGAAGAAGGPYALTAARFVAGAALLGIVTDAMLLGHWYLVQPGLPRAPIKELVTIAIVVWPVEVALWLAPPGMIDVLDGSIDDNYGGVLAAMWVLSALLTLALLLATWRALGERFYSAVMASTGLLYLAILTAFGTDVLARALLSP